MTSAPRPRIYLDSNILIYIVEGVEPWRTQLDSLLKAFEAGVISCVTSEFSIAEILVKPFLAQDGGYLREYSN